MFCIVCVDTSLLPKAEENESDLAFEDWLLELPSEKLRLPRKAPMAPPLMPLEVDTAEFDVEAVVLLPENPS